MFKIDARWNMSGNMKVGKIATFSTLAGDGVFETKYGAVSGTCSGHCDHCGRRTADGKRPPCYVFKSYRYQSVIDGHARNTLSIRENPDEAYHQLSLKLQRKRIPVKAARYHQSGEIENKVQFSYMNRTAGENPATPFFTYSKNYGVTVPALLAGDVPENHCILFSIWHEQGIEEYKKVAHLPNVKAFVYCDKNRDAVNGWGPEEYAARGINITTFCHAYGNDGKLDHNVTCDRCTKCFNRLASCKVVGCWDH